MERFLSNGVELVAVGELSLARAREYVVACEKCSRAAVQPFGLILSELAGRQPDSTEYILSAAIPCPNCSNPLTEMTLVEIELKSPSVIEDKDRQYLPPWEETEFVLVDEPTLVKAQNHLGGCEHCIPTAEITFDYLLDNVTGCDPTRTEYVLSRSATCPRCHQEVWEKTLVVAV